MLMGRPCSAARVTLIGKLALMFLGRLCLWEISGIPKNHVNGYLLERSIAQPACTGVYLCSFDWKYAYVVKPFLDLLEGSLKPLYIFRHKYLDLWIELSNRHMIKDLSSISMAFQHVL